MHKAKKKKYDFFQFMNTHMEESVCVRERAHCLVEEKAHSIRSDHILA